MGLCLAGQPAYSLQSCLGRPTGPTVVRAQEVRLVGRGAKEMDGLRCTGLPGGQSARLYAAARGKWYGCAFRQRSIHYEAGWQGLAFCSEGPEGWAAPRTL